MSDRQLNENTNPYGGGTSPENPTPPSNPTTPAAPILESMNQTGLNPRLDLQEFKAGFAGTTFINLFNGRATHYFEGFSTTNERYPISIGAFHTLARPAITASSRRTLSSGWWLNWDYAVNSTEKLITIIAPDGTVSQYQNFPRAEAITNFNITPDVNFANVYVDPVTYSYIQRNGTELTVIDRELNKFVITTAGEIRRIVKTDNTTINFQYTNNRLASITTEGHRIVFNYFHLDLQSIDFISENKRLLFDIALDSTHHRNITRIRLQDVLNWGGPIVNQYISTVVPPTVRDLFTARFTYEGNPTRIVRTIDETTNVSNQMQYLSVAPNRVSRVNTQRANPMQNNRFTTFSYATLNGVVTRTTINNQLGVVTHHEYNNIGQLMHQFDSQGNAKAFQYSTYDTFTNEQVLSWNSVVVNHQRQPIINNSFDAVDPYSIVLPSEHEDPEFRVSGWSINPNFRNEFLRISTGGVSGREILRIRGNVQPVSVVQSISVVPGAYNLNFFSRGIAPATIRARARWTSGNQSQETTQSITISANTANWTYRQLPTLNIPTNAISASIELTITANNTTGFIYFDNFKLNVNDIQKTSLIRNGFFDSEAANNLPAEWATNANVGVRVAHEGGVDLIPILGTRVFEFRANTREEQLTQIIPVSGNAFDEFMLSYWLRGTIRTDMVQQVVVTFRGWTRDDTETFTFNFSSQVQATQWQMSVHKIIPTRIFYSATITFRYRGNSPLRIGAIQLLRGDSGQYLEHDQRGNIINDAKTASSRASQSFDNEERIRYSSDAFGNITRFEYNPQRRLSRVTDQNNTIVNNTYDDRSNLTSTLVTSNVGNINTQQVFNQANRMTQNINEFGAITNFTYDRLGRIMQVQDPATNRTNFNFNNVGNILTLDSISGSTILGQNRYGYNEDLTLRTIQADNGSVFMFLYDNAQRVSEVSVNGLIIAQYSYHSISNPRITRQQFGIPSNEAYTFIYTTHGLLETIRFRSTELVRYFYNEKNQVARQTANGRTIFFSYDDAGNLIKSVDGKDVLGYEYNNLNILQKFTYNIRNTVRSYDYEYDHEYSSITSLDGFRQQILDTYNDDVTGILNPWTGANGLVSTNANPTREFDPLLGQDVSVVLAGRLPVYQFSSVNSNRNMGEEWTNRFRSNKSIFGWFRFDSNNNNANNTRFLEIRDITATPRVTMLVQTQANQMVFTIRNRNAASTQSVDNIIRVNIIEGYYFIGINIRNNELVVVVNDQQITVNTNISLDATRISNLVLGSLVGTNLTTRFFMLSIGATNHVQSDPSSGVHPTFPILHTEFNRALNIVRNVIPKAGVQFQKQDIYHNLHTVSLNGTLTSNHGLQPVSFIDIQRGNKQSKQRLFDYDIETQKFVFASFGRQHSLLTNVSRLAYKFPFSPIGFFSVRFKPVIPGGGRTILEARSTVENVRRDTAFGVTINEANQLSLFTPNGEATLTTQTASLNNWHTVGIHWQRITATQTRITLRFNGDSVHVDVNDLNFLHYQLNVGVRIDENGAASNWLNGQLEMLTFTSKKISIEQLNKILNEKNPYRSVKSHLDVLGRITNEVIDTGEKTFESKYEYVNPNTNNSTTSTRVDRINRSNGETVTYQYDVLGNVTRRQIGTNHQEYTYDGLSRILSMFDSRLNQTTRYTYTGNGNIQTIQTFNARQTTNPISSLRYEYDTLWPDRLLRVRNTLNNAIINNIEYNANYAGNPSVYGGNVLTWSGRNLTNVNTNRYYYNEAGIRRLKIVNSVRTDFDLKGTDIIAERRGNLNIIRYHYDESNLIIGFEYRNQNYFYIKDALGIITSIIDTNANVVARYEYDAWGRLLTNIPNDDTILGINRFVYKGYYLDTETGWYYLKSRYYDPNTCRFINADGMAYFNPYNVMGANLFVYCLNNPIMNYDPNGNFVIISALIKAAAIVIKKAVMASAKTAAVHLPAAAKKAGAKVSVSALKGGVVGGVFGVIEAAVNGDSLEKGFTNGFWRGAISGAIFGGLLHGVTSLGISNKTRRFAGFVIGYGMALGSGILENNVSIERSILGGVFGALGAGEAALTLKGFASDVIISTAEKVLDMILGWLDEFRRN